jgi:hypothetical protein
MAKKLTIAESADALKAVNHRKDYATCVQMVKKYQKARTRVASAVKAGEPMPPGMPEWPISFSFNKKGIHLLMKKSGCAGLRMYPAIHENGQLTLVLVAFDENGNNLTPGADSVLSLAKKGAKASGAKKLKALSADDSLNADDSLSADDPTMDESQINPPFNSPPLP